MLKHIQIENKMRVILNVKYCKILFKINSYIF